MLLLLIVVKLGAWDLDSCGVGGRDAQRIDAEAGELFDCGRIEEQSMAFFEDRPAFVAQNVAQHPLVKCAITTHSLHQMGS
jgi:hypothetical protein